MIKNEFPCYNSLAIAGILSLFCIILVCVQSVETKSQNFFQVLKKWSRIDIAKKPILSSISVFKTSVLRHTDVPVATFEFDMVY